MLNFQFMFCFEYFSLFPVRVKHFLSKVWRASSMKPVVQCLSTTAFSKLTAITYFIFRSHHCRSVLAFTACLIQTNKVILSLATNYMSFFQSSKLRNKFLPCCGMVTTISSVQTYVLKIFWVHCFAMSCLRFILQKEIKELSLREFKMFTCVCHEVGSRKFTTCPYQPFNNWNEITLKWTTLHKHMYINTYRNPLMHYDQWWLSQAHFPTGFSQVSADAARPLNLERNDEIMQDQFLDSSWCTR